MAAAWEEITGLLKVLIGGEWHLKNPRQRLKCRKKAREKSVGALLLPKGTNAGLFLVGAFPLETLVLQSLRASPFC